MSTNYRQNETGVSKGSVCRILKKFGGEMMKVYIVKAPQGEVLKEFVEICERKGEWK